MSELSSPRRRAVALPSPLWVVISCVLHAVLILELRDAPPEDNSPFKLANQVEFGLSDTPPGGGAPAAAPPPAKQAEPKTPKVHKPKPPRDPNAYTLAPDAGPPVVPDKNAREAKLAATAQGKAEGQEAAHSGEGDLEGATGDGSGTGLGDGSGLAPAGATIALNVDLDRVRKTALLLETESLLEIIPEWQGLLAGSGLTAIDDFTRVFVATPNLERSSLVVSARHSMPRARIDAAVGALAAQSGATATFRQQEGYAVAPWRSAGPPERVIALTGPGQLTITRADDLQRVLGVARALAQLRGKQGFEQKELSEQGGLLAMQPNEAVALWVEGVHRYVHGDAEGVPRSLRLSIYHVDQFNTELRIRGQYESQAAAAGAMTAMDDLRKQLSDNARVVFLGLKSAMDSAVIEQDGSALLLHVRLTLHQTRYLLRYVTRALRRG